MKVSSLGRAARSKAGIKVRQPLASVKVSGARMRGRGRPCSAASTRWVRSLNVKALEFAESPSELYDYKVSANTPLLGPKYGKDTPEDRQGASRDGRQRNSREGECWSEHSLIAGVLRLRIPKLSGTLTVVNPPGSEVILEPEEVNLQAVEKEGSISGVGGRIRGRGTYHQYLQELAREGMARELVHRLQTMRRSAGFRGGRSDSELPGRGGGSGGGPGGFRRRT